MPYPLPLTRTEAYLAYKAGVIQQSDLKPSLAVPRNGIDAWLAYWTGLAADYPKREDGTPHILQEEEAYIAYLCGVINEYPEKCLRRVGAYLRYIISARWGRPDHPLNREELYLSLIKTQFIPSGDPSSDIVIDGTAKAPFVDVKVYGDTFQQTYTGKNLFNKNDTGILDDVRVSTGDGKTYGSVGNHVSYFIKVEPSTTYALTTGRTAYYAWYSAPSEDSYISGSGWGDKYYFASPANAQYIRFDFADGNIVQFVKGTLVGDYEPYVGGQPSPNPDYPQQIQTVTGEQTVTVTGKNLFDKANPPSTLLDASASELETGLRITQTAAGQWKGCIFVLGKASDVAGQTINVHAIATKSASNLPFCHVSLCDASGGNRVIVKKSDSSEIDIAAVMPVNPSRGYYCIALLSNGSGTGNRGDYIDYEELMVYLGSASPVYAPYSKQTLPINLGTIELCKLGTYQDYIWKDGDSWKVHKATNKITVDGSENWVYPDSGANYTFFQFSRNNFRSKYGNAADFYASNTGVGFAKADKFEQIVASSVNMRTKQGIGFSTEGNGWFRISVANTIATTADAFKTWLSSHSTTIDYALATPTETTITDTTLIAQLEALLNGGAEEGTTYIKVNATDTNLPGLLYVEAPKYD